MLSTFIFPNWSGNGRARRELGSSQGSSAMKVVGLTGPDHLTIAHYNISPAGEEAKAVEIDYERVKGRHVR